MQGCMSDTSREDPGTTAPAGANEPRVLTDEGIRQWVEEQRRAAERLAQIPRRRSDALLILGHVKDIIERLEPPASAEVRRRIETRAQEILGELREHWEKRDNAAVPPLDVLRANAERYAYCECRRDVMQLVQHILALRGSATFNRRRLPNYRPVKRVR